MVSNRFALMLVVRVVLLTITLIGLSAAFIAPGYYAVTLLMTLITTALVFELYRYVSNTNAELTRFLAAMRYDDFGQSFQAVEPYKGKRQGKRQGNSAGFAQLGEAFSEIMQRFSHDRQQQESQLRQLKSLTEHIPVPLLSLFPDGRIQLHNNAARQLFAAVNVNKVEDLTAFGAGFAEAIKDLAPGRRQLVGFAFDGVERQMTVVMTQIITGNLCENLISLQDIQSELDDVQLQAWQDLVSVLTHEIMNSITPVASLAKTAADLVDDVRVKLNTNASADEVAEELVDVHRAVDTVARRSDSLMQFVQSYRSMSQLPKPQKQSLLLSDLCQRVEKLFVTDWAAKGVELTIKVIPESLSLVADVDMLEQVLINLLKNAEQAIAGKEASKEVSAGEGDNKPQVTLSGRMNQRGYVLLEVSDNGPGIPEAIRKQIFVPFYTTKREGSGVGLALTRQVMIAHGGNVMVSQSEAGGARFTLIF